MSVFFTSLLLFVTTATTAHAVLSAQTANTIEGTSPYLFVNGVKATNTDELLGITLSDGSNYKKSDLTSSNPGTSTNPLELPVAGQKLEDIITLIPSGQTTVTLNALVNTHGFWGDADGDGSPTVSGSGTLSISAVDANNNTVGLNDTLSACSSPYKVTLTSTAGTLKTTYGDPNETNFTGDSATYYIKPKIGAPYACWAQPNLTFGTAPRYVSASHPEWDSSKGFKLQNLGVPKSNFPRTGFNGAFFDMTVAGETAANVIAANESSLGSGEVNATLGSTNIKLKLSVSPLGTNVVRVRLWGPSSGQKAGQPVPAAVIMPTEFNLYSDAGKTNKIYSFELSKWFIARPGAAGGYAAAQTYCGGLLGSYRVPSVSEYTNANDNQWTWGLSGHGNCYARAIGNGAQKTAVGIDDSKGGLFAEWGFTYGNYANVTNPGYYTSSDFEYNGYWAVESYSPNQPYVLSRYGNVTFDYPPSLTNVRAACVTP